MHEDHVAQLVYNFALKLKDSKEYERQRKKNESGKIKDMPSKPYA